MVVIVVEMAKAHSNSLCIQKGMLVSSSTHAVLTVMMSLGYGKNNPSRPRNSYDSMTPALEQVW
jgi:hypothetical protein